MSETKSPSSWIRPNEVMALHRLKVKKRSLQARINRTTVLNTTQEVLNSSKSNESERKRHNPFIRNNENKRPKIDNNVNLELSESSDNTLFKLLHPNTPPVLDIDNKSSSQQSSALTSFTNVFQSIESTSTLSSSLLKKQGEKWIPIDWSLKSKLRLMAPKPFGWNRTLKTSEEASGITGFVRCLDTRVNTSLDTSPNAQFHQCCLYWQHPALPWLQLFPRTLGRVSATLSSFTTTQIKESLHTAWTDSFRSLFQLVRARQCPYFYICANTFTACFRAAGICGHSELHVLLTPTTRGFRQMLRQEDVAYTMPLKNKRRSLDGTMDLGYDTLDATSQTTWDESHNVNNSEFIDEEDEPPDEEWLESMGVNAEDIKKMNTTQAKIQHRNECEIDNSEQSLVFIEGIEAHGLYNLLLNCRSIVASTGSLAGVPPTLLAPVAFHGATLQSLKVRESKIHDNNNDYYSIELSGPILPTTIHNLYSLLKKDCNVSATFANLTTTAPFSKITPSKLVQKENDSSSTNPTKCISGNVFGQENLSDCGLNSEILKHFCSSDESIVQYYDSLKYVNDTEHYIWL